MSEVNSGGGERAAVIEARDDLDEINQLYRDRQWSDGLPIVPPTAARVDRMLRHTKRARGEVVARIAPGFGAATIERITINAVMAGCDAEYLPILIAATEAVADPKFNLQGIQATTNPVAVWLVINGPIAKRLNFNSTFNCLGEGAWANATVGRAMRLILRNIGGALPGDMDRATQGQPGKYTFCCAENEDESPWPALHVERGFARDRSTVTVIGAEGTINMNSHAKTVDELLRVFGDTMIHPPSNEYTHGGEPWIMIGPEHAEVLKRGGMSKDDVKRRLWETSKMPASRMSVPDRKRAQDSRREELGEFTPDQMLTIAKHPGNICLMVAGGPGTHSVYVPCFGNSHAVTVEIEQPA
jgi:hypothetical protein